MTRNARSRKRYSDFWLGCTSDTVAQALREHVQAVIAAKVSRITAGCVEHGPRMMTCSPVGPSMT